MKLRNNLIWSFVGISVAVAITFTVSQYFTAKGRYEQDLRDKLSIIAHLASLSVDGDMHRTLQKKEDEGTQAYAQIQKVLKEIKKSDADIAYVYTMRKRPVDNAVIFVVDSTEDMEEFSHLGDVYDDVTQGQEKALQPNAGTILEDDFYSDKWGTFLSAYGPILAKDGTFDGVVGVDISIENYQAAIHYLLIKAATLSLAITIVAVLIAFLLARRITQPISVLIPVLKEIAAANLSVDVPAHLAKRKDEIGDLGRSVEYLKNNLRQIIAELSDGAQLLLPSSSSLSSFAGTLEANTNSLSSQVLSVTAATDQSSKMVTSIANNANEVSHSIATTSAAVDEMTHSLNEIDINCRKEAAIVQAASSKTTTTSNLMAQLNASSNEIGKIVEVIKEIASQTNLLALNATIEAARAGETGKGFAVVANEIKVLAQQTADSSQQIREQIFEMQSNTNNAVEAIGEITQLIEQVAQTSQIIVSAVHEQGVIINEISDNMTTSSKGASAIAQHVDDSAQSLSAVSASMHDVNQIAITTADSVESIKKNSYDLEQLALKLEEIVKRFRTK
jgi:methyl-accepting chemotaxis protein